MSTLRKLDDYEKRVLPSDKGMKVKTYQITAEIGYWESEEGAVEPIEIIVTTDVEINPRTAEKIVLGFYPNKPYITNVDVKIIS